MPTSDAQKLDGTFVLQGMYSERGRRVGGRRTGLGCNYGICDEDRRTESDSGAGKDEPRHQDWTTQVEDVTSMATDAE